MSGVLSLNGAWGLTWAEGTPLMPSWHYTGPHLRGRSLLPATVPASIHTVLQEAGLLDDVNIGLNSLKARWVEEAFWIYRRTFTASQEAATQSAWLCFDCLELDATVYLNGEEIGKHANSLRPARFNVTGKLREGENLLVVLISTGFHTHADKLSREYGSDDISLLTKRMFRRTPQYQHGWDWNARLTNVGILGDVRLEWHAAPRLDQVTVFAVPSADLTTATLHVRATIDGLSDTPLAGVLRARIVETGQEINLPISITAGENRHEVTLEIANPRLWWPINHGEQFRYTVEIAWESVGETQTATRKTGVRKVEIDQTPHPVEGRFFIITINNRPIFCKGGNWVPADLLYGTVTAARYRELVELAVGANFNLLRIWGGGLFTDHAFCDVCDELGVLIWHDFLFACSKYPGDMPDFVKEVQQEVTYAVRELAHHPALIVWCGNNEIEWGDWGWGYDSQARTHPHYTMFHRDIPRIVKYEDPSTAHWLSSPSSPDYIEPNSPIVGDQHPWTVSMEQGGANWWKYRTYVDRFPNEGGVMGATSITTLRQFLPEGERHLFSPSWEHHDNPFACIDSVQGNLGHVYQTIELWLGRNPEEMSLEEYAYISALLQADGLKEYIENYRRRMFSSSSAIFWMYNDSWPVTNGWTIVDYYRRRKLAYHPVRRAFQPVTVVVADDGEMITVYGVNDTPQSWSGTLRYGLFTLAGAKPLDVTQDTTLPANASTPLAQIPRAQWETLDVTQSGAFAVLLQHGTLYAQHRLFVARFKELAFTQPHITLERHDGILTLTADAFAWGVCIDLTGELPLADDCIDLLPGIPYSLPWPKSLGDPVIAKIGNRDALGTA